MSSIAKKRKKEKHIYVRGEEEERKTSVCIPHNLFLKNLYKNKFIIIMTLFGIVIILFIKKKKINK